jgi:hypothetical protein
MVNAANPVNPCNGFVALRQGDRIGRIFAHWVAVYCGHFYENYRSGPHFWPTYLCPLLRLHSNFGKKGLDYILGDLFQNSSGHPALRPFHH